MEMNLVNNTTNKEQTLQDVSMAYQIGELMDMVSDLREPTKLCYSEIRN